MDGTEAWPALPLEAWQETRDTLHMWTQILGKIRLKLTPHVNHWWQVPFYLTSRGLTTTPIPYGDGTFDATFDFIDHVLVLQTSNGRTETIALRPRSVADFYHDVIRALQGLAIDVRIWTKPSEYPNPIRFEEDTRHAAYDAAYAHRFWRILLRADTILKEFRGRFVGKASPVHFFWGGFDLAVTRFSGRRAPPIAGADSMTREGYSHEVSSCGFWPGAPGMDAMFYSYAYPEPPGFSEYRIEPVAASYSGDFGEFVLPYEAVRRSADPDGTLLKFLQSTYEAAANLGKWDRPRLEVR